MFLRRLDKGIHNYDVARKFVQMKLFDVAEKAAKRCSVAGCDRKRVARGYCHAHYKRVTETGNPGCAEIARRKQPRDLAGKKYGRLIAEEVSGFASKGPIWKCKCDCGNTRNVSERNLITGHTKSCGCWRKEMPKTRTKAGERAKGMLRRRINSDGYVVVYLPEHPNATSGGSVKEHIMVMSDILGRPLLPGETVHHKNGVRTDNHPENLELWANRHGPGQRVEDKVRWARELLKKYAPDELKSDAIRDFLLDNPGIVAELVRGIEHWRNQPTP